MQFKSILFLLPFWFISTVHAQDTYEIKLKIDGIEDSVAYLGYHYGDKKYVQDTAEVDASGQILFKGDKRLKKGVYFLYSPKFYMEFVVVEQQFAIETTKDDIYGNMVVEGSEENSLFREFQLLMKSYQVEVNKLSGQLADAKSKEDSSSIYSQIGDYRTKNVAFRDSLEQANSDKYTGALLRLMRSPKELKVNPDSISADTRKKQYAYYKTHFFDGIDFEDEGTMRAPVFHNKVIEYLEKVTIQNPDSVIASMDYILEKCKNNEEMFRYWLVSSFQKYQNAKIMGMDKVFFHLGENYYLKGKATWADDEMIKKLSEELVFHRENQIGMKAPQIHLIDTLEKPLDLYSLDAKYTILYFYSPTCGHCKKKTPDMLNLYHELKDDGLKIVGVCTDTEMDKWKGFIKDFELDWINAADLYYKSNFRVQYNVRSTPTIFLLDKDKKILAKKLDVDQLSDFLKNMIAYDQSQKEKLAD